MATPDAGARRPGHLNAAEESANSAALSVPPDARIKREHGADYPSGAKTVAALATVSGK